MWKNTIQLTWEMNLVASFTTNTIRLRIDIHLRSFLLDTLQAIPDSQQFARLSQKFKIESMKA